MKISYNWLKEFLPNLTHSPEEVAEVLTLHSFETVVAGNLKIPAGIQVVKITNVEKHPDADRLQLATITDGKQEVTVVCGAPNIAAGQVVPYSPPGTVLQDEEGSEFTVREAKIRGVKSPGMLNSLRELGLHPKAHEGIWILPADTPLGTALADHVPVDTILDADITPNRAHDCMSHLGIARELAALLRLELHEQEFAEIPEEKSALNISIADEHDTPRYFAAEVREAKIAPSPLWMQVRLLAAGGKPKNNLVDITNYALFEIGNPSHLFDAKSIPSKDIAIRRAEAGEKIIALDEETYELTADDLVIASSNKPVAIAGIMGGQETGVGSDTDSLLLEVANFRPYAIQETSRRLNLRSESSARFSKGIHPTQVEVAARRIIWLLQSLAGANIVATVDIYPNPGQPQIVSFRPQAVTKVLGSKVANEEMQDMLHRLRFTVVEQADTWDIMVPHDRLDIEGEHDIVEEIVRLVGLNEIKAKHPEKESRMPLAGETVLRERLRDNLVALGLTETYNYSFEPARYAKQLGLDKKPHLLLTNPPAPELANLRISLLPGLLANLVTNRTAFGRSADRKERALFEIGSTYVPGEGGRVPGVIEEQFVAGVVVGGVPTADAIIQAIADAYGVDSRIVSEIGSAHLLERDVSHALKYRLPVVVFECNLSQLVHHAGEIKSRDYAPQSLEAMQYVPYSKYPSIIRDISLLVDPQASVEAVQEVITRVGGDLVVDVDLFDELEWKDTGKKALAFHVEYQAMDRTLTDEEVGKIHEKIVSALTQELSTEIR